MNNGGATAGQYSHTHTRAHTSVRYRPEGGQTKARGPRVSPWTIKAGHNYYIIILINYYHNKDR